MQPRRSCYGASWSCASTHHSPCAAPAPMWAAAAAVEPGAPTAALLKMLASLRQTLQLGVWLKLQRLQGPPLIQQTSSRGASTLKTACQSRGAAPTRLCYRCISGSPRHPYVVATGGTGASDSPHRSKCTACNICCEVNSAMLSCRCWHIAVRQSGDCPC